MKKKQKIKPLGNEAAVNERAIKKATLSQTIPEGGPNLAARVGRNWNYFSQFLMRFDEFRPNY